MWYMKHTKYILRVRCIRLLCVCILAAYLPVAHCHCKPFADQFFKQVIIWIERFGIRDTIARVKLTRSAVLRYFTNQPIITEGLSLDTSG